MKKIFLSLALLAAAVSVAMAADSMNAIYDPDQNSGGTPVMVMMAQNEPTSPDWHTFAESDRFGFRLPPIETITVRLSGDYWSSFSFWIGSPDGRVNPIHINMVNLTTGERARMNYAQAGPDQVQISNPEGRWWIVLHDVSGVYYSGVFSANSDVILPN